MEGATESGTAPTHHCFVLQRQLRTAGGSPPGPRCARRIPPCSLESATSWTGSCITSAGVREEGPGREDLAHGPVDQSPLRSCLRKRKALLLQVSTARPPSGSPSPPGGSDSGPLFLGSRCLGPCSSGRDSSWRRV